MTAGWGRPVAPGTFALVGALAAMVAVGAGAAAGCSTDGAGPGDHGEAPALVVSAASSLTDAFGELAGAVRGRPSRGSTCC